MTSTVPEYSIDDPLVVIVVDEFLQAYFARKSPYGYFNSFVSPYASMWNAEYGVVVTDLNGGSSKTEVITSAAFKFKDAIDYTFFKLTFHEGQLVPPGVKDPHSYDAILG